MSPRRERLGILLIATFVLSNLFLKGMALGSASFWLDEAYTAFHAQRTPWEIVRLGAWDENPPLFLLLMSGWVRVFGLDEAAVRSFSLISALATVPLLFRLARRFFGLEAAVITSTLFAVSGIQYAWTRQARGYMLSGLLSTLSVYLLLDLLETGRRSRAVALGLINALLLWTHTSNVLLLPCELVGALLINRRRFLRPYLASQALSTLLFLPWIPVALRTSPAAATVAWREVHGISTLFTSFGILAGSVPSLAFMAVLVSLCGLALIARREKSPRFLLGPQAVFLSTVAIGPPILLYALSVLIAPVFQTQYVLFSSVGQMLLAGVLVSVAPVHAGVRALLVVPAVVLSLASRGQVPETREDWRGAAALIRRQQGPPSPAVILQASYTYRPYSYYAEPAAFRDPKRARERLRERRVFLCDTAKDLESVPLDGLEKVILVQAHEKIVDPEESLRSALGKLHDLERLFVVPGIRITVLRHRRAGPAGETASTSPLAGRTDRPSR